jgi:hypothetical protein
MSRKLRIEYPGAMYHVMSRGDQREDIFRDDQDRQRFDRTDGSPLNPNKKQAVKSPPGCVGQNSDNRFAAFSSNPLQRC